jgi:hypothetical protein
MATAAAGPAPPLVPRATLSRALRLTLAAHPERNFRRHDRINGGPEVLRDRGPFSAGCRLPSQSERLGVHSRTASVARPLAAPNL